MSDVIPGMRASMDPVVGLATTTTAPTGSAERPEAG